MKAVIIAAGKGKRLKHYTENLPKCLLKVGEKSILEWQLTALHSCGVKDITIIRGYQAEKINFPGCKYYFNDRYESNNILNSLMYARAGINGDVLISYSDILYDPCVVQRLQQSPHEVSVVVDTDWKKQYQGREEHPLGEAENVFMDPSGRLIEIGKKMARKDEANGEFIGMIRLSGKGPEKFLNFFDQARELFWGRPFMKAEVFEKAYLTDMLQYMIDEGEDVFGVKIQGGWREIDTVADYEKARRDFGAGAHSLNAGA